MPKIETKQAFETTRQYLETSSSNGLNRLAPKLETKRKELGFFYGLKEKAKSALSKIKNKIISPKFLSSMSMLLLSVGMSTSNVDACNTKYQPEVNNQSKTETVHTLKVDDQGNISLKGIANKNKLNTEITGSNQQINKMYADGAFRLVNGDNGTHEVKINIIQLKKSLGVKPAAPINPAKNVRESKALNQIEAVIKTPKLDNKSSNSTKVLETKPNLASSESKKPLGKPLPPPTRPFTQQTTSTNPKESLSTPNIKPLQKEQQIKPWDIILNNLALGVGFLAVTGAGITCWMNRKKLVVNAEKLAYAAEQSYNKNTRKLNNFFIYIKEVLLKKHEDTKVSSNPINISSSQLKSDNKIIPPEMVEQIEVGNISTENFYQIISKSWIELSELNDLPGIEYNNRFEPNLESFDFEKQRLGKVVNILKSSLENLYASISSENDYRYALASIEEFDRMLDYLSPLFLLHEVSLPNDMNSISKINKIRKYLYHTTQRSKINPMIVTSESDFKFTKENYNLSINKREGGKYLILGWHSNNLIDYPRALAQEIFLITKQNNLQIDIKRSETVRQKADISIGEIQGLTGFTEIESYIFRISNDDYKPENLQKIKDSLIQNRRDKLNKLIADTGIEF